MRTISPERRKKLTKILLWVVPILLVVVIFGPMARDWAIRKSVEKTASSVLGVPVSIGGFTLSLLTGRATVTDFQIANPRGFQEPEALRFREITLDLDVSTLFSDEITVNALLVDGLSINFDLKLDGSSNLGELRKNVESFIRTAAPPQKTEPKHETSNPPKTEEAAGQRLVIRRLTVKNTGIRLTMFKTTANMTLPDLEMADVGKGQDLAQTLDGFLTQTLNAASQTGLTQKNLQKTGEALTEVGNAAADTLKDSGKKLEKGVKKLFR